MTRTLRAATDDEIPTRVRAALAGSGDAVFCGTDPGDLPDAVAHRVAIVVQSSGSTARPKRVMLSADALLASAAASASAIGGQGQWLLALPTNYIAGVNVLVRSIAAETDPVSLPAGPFTPAAFVAAAERLEHPLRYTSLVPAQFARLLDDERATSALLRFDRVLLGGQATPPALVATARSLGIAITRTYGSSETCGGCVYDGLPIGAATVRLAEEGEVEIAGPVLAEGYLDDVERTEAAFHHTDGQRWYRTGDTGSMSDGVLSITGRRDDVIVSGGVKVSLGEVERCVRQSTPLHDAIVVALDDELWGQVPAAVSTVGMPLDELREVVANALGQAARPARLEVVASIPMLPSGKPDRLAIRLSLAR